MTQEEIKATFIEVAGKLGVPFVILMFVLVMAREAGTGLHKTVIIPFMEGHTRFLDRTSETLNKISTIQEKQATTLQELTDIQDEIRSMIITSGSKNFRQETSVK